MVVGTTDNKGYSQAEDHHGTALAFIIICISYTISLHKLYNTLKDKGEVRKEFLPMSVNNKILSPKIIQDHLI